MDNYKRDKTTSIVVITLLMWAAVFGVLFPVLFIWNRPYINKRIKELKDETNW